VCMLHELKLRLLFVNTCHRLKEVWIYSLAVTFRLLSHSFKYTATKKMKLAGTPAEIKPRAWRIVVQNFT
jgi:hypothetical protein